MCLRRGTSDLAEPIPSDGCGLLLYHKRCIRRGEGEERLQDEDWANYAHGDDGTLPGEAQSRLFYSVELAPPLGVSLGACVT